MISPRLAIRQAVKSRLVAQLPVWDTRLIEARISINRSTPLFAAKLPAILIYTRDERIEDSPNADPGLRYRKLDLSVEVIAGGDKAEEDIEQIVMAVESILDADETLGLSVEGMRLTRIELDQDGEGEIPILAARMNFEVSYWTRPTEVPDAPLPFQVLVSQAPQIGIPNEAKYQPIGTEWHDGAPNNG